jgi:kynureninase
MTDIRSRFEVPGGGPYLLAHSVGALPLAARASLETAMLRPWAERGSDGWPDWLDAVDGFRAALAGLLGGEASQYCPQVNLSGGLFRLLAGLPAEAGRDVLLASEQSFPSIGFALSGLERLGYRLKLLTGDPGKADSWAADIGAETAAVVVMHVHSNSGAVAPVAEVAALAKAAGALSIADVAQSTGILPVSIPAWGVDAVIGSCVKWLCGGPGAGWLWASTGLTARAKPIDIGWFSHENPFEFDIRDFRHAPDARRFWGGTPSVAPYALATGAIATIAEIGVDSVLAANRRLIARVAEKAGDRWFEPDRTGFGGTLCIAAGPDVEAALRAAGCRLDRRGEVLRLSFHVYNHDAEADLVGEVLAKAG